MLPVSCQGPVRLTVPATPALLPSGREARVETVICCCCCCILPMHCYCRCCVLGWAGLGWGTGMGLGVFNPEALVYLLLSSGPPPLRCTRPAGYGSLTCLKADKSPRSPVDTSPRTNPEPSHIPALFPPLRFLHLVLPSSPRVFRSGLVSANPQNPPRRLLLALDQFPWYLHNRPAGSTSSRTAREKRSRRTGPRSVLIAPCLASIEFSGPYNPETCNLTPPESHS
jgi:hypothetical protein